MTHWSRLFGNDEQISTVRDISSLLLRVGGLGLPCSETTLTSHLFWVSWDDALPMFQDRVLGLEFEVHPMLICFCVLFLLPDFVGPTSKTQLKHLLNGTYCLRPINKKNRRRVIVRFATYSFSVVFAE